MKKLYICLIAFSLVVTAAFSQVTLGLKIGPGLTGVNADPYKADQDLSVVFNGGVYAGIYIVDHFMMQPEINVSVGNIYSTEFTTNNITTQIDMEAVFLEVPVLFKGALILGDGVFSIYLGPQLSVGLGDINYKTTQGDNTIIHDFSYDDANINRWNLSGVAGLDYE